MRSLEHHAAIDGHLRNIGIRVQALATLYATVEQRNAADDALIDILSEQAASLLAAAEHLKTIDLPTPPEPEPETEGGEDEGDPGDEA